MKFAITFGKTDNVFFKACLLPFVFMLAGTVVVGAAERPHIGYVFPAGMKQGEQMTVLLGGQNLEGSTQCLVTGSGVEGRVISFTRSLDKQELRNLNNRKISLEEMLSKATDEEKEKIQKQLNRVMELLSFEEPPPHDPETMQHMEQMQKKKQLNRQLTDLVRVEMTCSTQALPGRRELRLLTPQGASEPLSFYVGELNEYSEREPNDGLEQAVPISSLPAVMNGQILPGDLDRFSFSARKGQQLVFAVQARALMPYLADAVPGWFQAVLTLYNDSGKELAYADDFMHNPDPVLTYTAPAEGKYILAIRDSIHRGREDFVYRITAGELPYVTGIFPLGGPAGKKTKVRLKGINLSASHTVVDPHLIERDIFSLAPGLGGYNPILFQVDRLPEIFEGEGNNTLTQAQRVTLPVVINGLINQPGDVDVFRFHGSKGDQVTVEVYARRLGSPLDSAIKLVYSQNVVLQANDDFVDNASGLVTHHADSYIAGILPTNGTYYVLIRDVQNKGGDLHGYRLRLSPPRPDFKLRFTPSCLSMPRGGSIPLSVHAQRNDGFDGEIGLSLEDPPPGFALSGGTIPKNEKTIRVTLTGPDNEDSPRLNLHLVGTAKVGGSTVTHTALPAEDMTQAFANRHLVPSEDFILTLTKRNPAELVVNVPDGKAKLPVGREIEFPLGLVRGPRRGKNVHRTLELELDAPPKGISIASTTADFDSLSAAVIIRTGPATKAGLKGNLIFNAYLLSEAKEQNTEKQKRQFLCTLPAVPFEVVP